MTVGEPFTVEVKATGPAGTTCTFPRRRRPSSSSCEAGGGSRRARAPSRARTATRPTSSLSASCRFPPITVRYRLPDGTAGRSRLAPLSLKVVSLLPKEEAEQTARRHPGAGERPVGRAFWVALALALLLVAGLVTLVLRRKRTEAAPAAAPVPELAPDVEARGALEALARRGPAGARGEHRPFYIALTAIAKRYLERRLEAPIVEMTSSETLAFLRGHRTAARPAPVVRDLAEAADRSSSRRRRAGAEAERHLAPCGRSSRARGEAAAGRARETEGKAA